MSMSPRRENYDVVVIGAGPAGLAAAATAAGTGLSTLLLDENAGPGGQVWRAIASTPVQQRDTLGADYWEGAELVGAVAEVRDHLRLRVHDRAGRILRFPYNRRISRAEERVLHLLNDAGETGFDDLQLDNRKSGRCCADHLRTSRR